MANLSQFRNYVCFELSCFDVFDIKKVSGKFRNEEDEAFYLDQKENRIATIGAVDLADTKKIMANQLRKQREEIEEKNKTKQKGRSGKRKLVLEVRTPPKHEKRQRFTGSYADLDSSICNDQDWEEPISPRGKNLRAQINFNRVNASIDKETFLDNIALVSDKTLTPSRTAVQIVGAALSTAMDSGEGEITRLTLPIPLYIEYEIS